MNQICAGLFLWSEAVMMNPLPSLSHSMLPTFIHLCVEISFLGPPSSGTSTIAELFSLSFQRMSARRLLSGDHAAPQHPSGALQVTSGCSPVPSVFEIRSEPEFSRA